MSDTGNCMLAIEVSTLWHCVIDSIDQQPLRHTPVDVSLIADSSISLSTRGFRARFVQRHPLKRRQKRLGSIEYWRLRYALYRVHNSWI